MFSRDPAICLDGPGPYAPYTINIDPREEGEKPHIVTRNRDYCWRAVRTDGLCNAFRQGKFEGFERGELASYNAWFGRMCREYC